MTTYKIVYAIKLDISYAAVCRTLPGTTTDLDEAIWQATRLVQDNADVTNASVINDTGTDVHFVNAAFRWINAPEAFPEEARAAHRILANVGRRGENA